MSPISPADSNIVPRREFIRDQHPASSFSILALSGPALLRLYSFPPDAVHALRKHLDSAHLIISSREVIQNNFCELSLDGKPWSNPKSTRTEKLLIDILFVLYRNDYSFLSTLDYGREQDDRIKAPFHKKSNDSLTVVPHPVKVPFAISFISQSVLRVISPPLHLTPAILQTVRGSWPRGVVSEKIVAENVYEFKFKGYGWFQEDTFATDSLRHILSLLGSLDVFGFTLLTSLPSMAGLSQTIPIRGELSCTNQLTCHLQPSGPYACGNSTGPTSCFCRPSNASHDNIPEAETPTHRTTHAEELRMELQSSVGSAVDMTGVGTHKYGRAGEPEETIHQRMPSRFYGNLHLPGTPAPAAKSPQSTGPSGDAPSTSRDANPAPNPSRSRPSHRKSTSQSGTPPLLGPGAFRDSANSSNSNHTVDVPIAWTGTGKENGHTRDRSRSRDPKDNVLPGGWVPAPTGAKDFKAPGDHPNPNESHRHKHSMTPLPHPEEQRVRPARSGRATLPRSPPYPCTSNPTPGRRDLHPAKGRGEGWVLVNVGHPGMPGAPPHAISPPPQHSLQRKQSFPPVSQQRPPPAHSPYSTGMRGYPLASLLAVTRDVQQTTTPHLCLQQPKRLSLPTARHPSRAFASFSPLLVLTLQASPPAKKRS
ncbi:hypothetical protein EI94DRAFT_1725563 [Lactarius quietus]|nr:hypothetical protein EI94DRAFT_1725563 [Lactarius quietus]